MSSQRNCMPKKIKSYWSISEIGPSPAKVDADVDTDAPDTDNDGQVGIWKSSAARWHSGAKKVIKTFLRN